MLLRAVCAAQSLCRCAQPQACVHHQGKARSNHRPSLERRAGCACTRSMHASSQLQFKSYCPGGCTRTSAALSVCGHQSVWRSFVFQPPSSRRNGAPFHARWKGNTQGNITDHNLLLQRFELHVTLRDRVWNISSGTSGAGNDLRSAQHFQHGARNTAGRADQRGVCHHAGRCSGGSECESASGAFGSAFGGVSGRDDDATCISGFTISTGC